MGVAPVVESLAADPHEPSSPKQTVDSAAFAGSKASWSEPSTFPCPVQGELAVSSAPRASCTEPSAFAHSLLSGGPAVQEALEILLDEVEQTWLERLNLLRKELEGKVRDAEGRANRLDFLREELESKVANERERAHIAEATLSEAMLEAGRQIQAATEVAQNADSRASSERARARDLVAQERAAIQLRVAEFDREAACLHQEVASLAVQLAESRLARTRLEEQLSGAEGKRQLRERARSQLGQHSRKNTVGKALGASANQRIGASARSKIECDVRDNLEAADRVGQLKHWVLSIAAQPSGPSGSEGTPMPVGSPRSVPGSPVSPGMSRTSVPSLSGARSPRQLVTSPRPPRRRAASVDSRLRRQGEGSCAVPGHEANRRLLRSQVALANATRNVHMPSFVPTQVVPEPVTQGVSELASRARSLA